MGIQNALIGVRNKIINQYAEYTTDNCSIGDEAVFNYTQSTAGAQPTCVIIEYSGFTRRPKSEMRSTTIDWRISVNAFFKILDTDYVTPLNSARDFVDSFIVASVSDPTFGNSVMSVQVTDGSEPMSYRRVNHEYVFVALTVNILDNISG